MHAVNSSPAEEQDTPRIYVACLAAYNAGRLHGAWIDANQDPDDLHEAIQTMLARSPEPDAEEWAIHDYDSFGGIALQEGTSMDTVSELAAALVEHGELFGAVYEQFHDIDQAKTCMEDSYLGAWDSLEDWATNFLEETGQLEALPQHLQCYFDTQAFARDCELGGDVFTVHVNGSTHVFSNT